MKQLTLILLFSIALALLIAQNPLSVGKSQINAGVGFSNWNVPLYVGFDYGVHKDISLGGEISYHAYREKYESEHYNHAILGFIGNGNFHFNHVMNIPKDWDFYAGLNLGLYVWSSPDNYPGDHSTGLGLGAQVGGRYFFSDKTGVNLEIGGGHTLSGGKFGITVKF